MVTINEANMEFDNRVPKKHIERLSAHLNKIYDKDDFVPLEVLADMCFVSTQTGFESAVILNKKCQVIDVYIGDKTSVSMSVPKEEHKQNGLRIIHTHPSGNCKLSEMDKSLLMNNGLDCICAVSVKDGQPYDAEVGFINGQLVDTVFVRDARYINKNGLMEKITEYNELFIQNNDQNTTAKEQERAVLVVCAFDKKTNIDYSLQELESLAGTQGIITVGKVSQRRAAPDPAHIVGEGKIDEILQFIQLNNANIVIFDNELSGSKRNNLETIFGVKVIDRSSLILDIFATRANSKEAILQTELAQLKYNLPRLRGVANSAGRFGGGVGQRGPGESPLEINKRIMDKAIQQKELELQKVKESRSLTRKKRQKNNIKSVAIVGYTNSGKSTLLNTITKAAIYVKDELFATLNTTTRSVWLEQDCEIVLTDTVGFISNLPHEFINAFSSTLEETIEAELLLHVVDASNPDYKLQQEVVEELLKKLNATTNIITVYNKIDKVKDVNALPKGKDITYISASKNIGVNKLRDMIVQNLKNI